ncbi:MAG: site-2 protease family protein [Bdellovibrionota bacterium]
MGGDVIRNLFLMAPPFILSLSIHEWAHAWSAHKLGDPTAKISGRMTIDPLAHISWIGTVIFPAIAIMFGAPFFGWAKPVPVDPRYFKNPRGGMAIVAAAGPISNIILAIILTFTLGRLLASELAFTSPLAHSGIEMLKFAIQINVFLAVFNLIPLPPLDGSRILQGLVGRRLADKIDQAAPMMEMLLLVLIFTGFFRIIAVPASAILMLLQRFFL